MKRTVTSLAFLFVALLGGSQTFAQKITSHNSYEYLKTHDMLRGYTSEQLVALQHQESTASAQNPIQISSAPTPITVIQSQVLTAGPDTTICGGSVTVHATL